MNTSNWRWLRTISFAALCLTVVGCAEMVTYSEDAQREGMRLYKRGDYADAAGAFRNSVRQNPRNYQGYSYLGASYAALGQYQQSIAAYKTARQTIDLTEEGKIDGESKDRILNGLASAIAKSDQRDIETNAAAEEARNFSTSESWFLLAKIYAHRGDADNAIDAYNRAALIEPTDFFVARDYGLYLDRVGQRQLAQAPLRRAYSLNQEDQQVVAALRRCGVVPGPSLVEEDRLTKPIIPKGPIPQVKVQDMLPGSSESTVAAPRD